MAKALAEKTWSLPTLYYVKIDYRTTDAWSDAGGYFHEEQCIQDVVGTVIGCHGEDEETELGKLYLSTIDLYEAAENLYLVLDSRSGEWASYYPLLGKVDEEGVLEEVRRLLIFDQMTLIPDARGHGLGLHAMARAIRTWSPVETCVILTAGPTEGFGDDYGPGRVVAAERIARYWSRLGLEEFSERPSRMPVLHAETLYRTFGDKLREHCAWASPEQAT